MEDFLASYSFAEFSPRNMLEAFLDGSNDGFIVLDTGFRVLYFNEAYNKFHRLHTGKNLPGGCLLNDLYLGENTDEVMQYLQKALAGETVKYTITYPPDDNNAYCYELEFYPLKNNGSEIEGAGNPSIKEIVINARDITERKKLTEDLAANAERLNTAQHIAKLGYCEYNFGTKDYFLSDELYEILDLKEEDLKEGFLKTLKQKIHPEDRERVSIEVRKAVEQVTDIRTELRLKTNDRQKVVIALGIITKTPSGAPEKISVTIQDITDTRNAALALQTLEGHFKALFDNSIDGIIISSLAGDIHSANPAMCKITGYTPQEILGVDRSRLLDINSDDVKQILEIRSKAGVYRGEISIKHKDGHFIPIELTSIEMKDAEGNIYYSNILRDITEKKKIEEHQKALTHELEKNNKDLQQFSFITSHNLRAPVANLISLLSLYNKANPAEQFNKLLVDKFEEATLQLNSTLNDLINVLVIKSNTNIDKEVLKFSSVFNRVKTNIESLLFENSGTLTGDFSEADSIEYNKIHLESIFLNLVSNAIRYRSPERNPVIQIKSYRQDSCVIVSFADNGLGIDLKRYGDRLFGLYQRFHQSKDGKGLGLYMVNSQVVAMGGKIEVESEPGTGTTFKIHFKC